MRAIIPLKYSLKYSAPGNSSCPKALCSPHGGENEAPRSWITFLPAVACGAQDPVLAVIKVNATVGWEESMGQFTCGTVKAVVQSRDQAVGVVDWVET